MRTKYVEMKSPITGGRVRKVCTTEEQSFRGEKFTVHSHYYICEDTGEEFTVDGQDSITLNDLYSQYRNRHGIPYPDEIKAIRERYCLNYKQISTILGFGENQYAQYERGQVPSDSNGKMIAAIKDKGVLLSMLERCRGEFPEVEYGKILEKIQNSREEEKNGILDILYKHIPRSIYTGFSSFNSIKTEELIKMFICKADCFFASKLNKAMFYADFGFYKTYGRSITGMEYRAIQFGAVPYKYNTVYENVNGVNSVVVMAHGDIAQKYQCDNYNENVFTQEEIDYLNLLCEKVKGLSTEQIIKSNHKESAWIDYNEHRKIIPYSEALDLILI